MKTFLLSILLVVCIFSLCACGETEVTASNRTNTDTIEYNSSAKEVTINLEGNPSTGYLWSANYYDVSIIELDELDSIPTNSNPDVVGAPEIYRYKIKGLEEGETFIEFEYTRSLDEDPKDAKIFDVVVNSDKTIEVSELELDLDELLYQNTNNQSEGNVSLSGDESGESQESSAPEISF